MSFVSDDHSRRLERARRQYENLLMHAGDVLVEKEQGTANLDNSFATDAFDHYTASSPLRGRSVRGANDSRFQSPSVNRSVFINVDDSLFDENPIADKDKDSIIVSLQEEIERLRDKLESIVSSVETVIQDAQGAQDEIQTEHDRQIYELNLRNTRLEEENKQLRVTLELSQAELAVERDHLLKAARFIERLKRRGREYTDVQRKSHSLLLSSAPLTSSTGTSTVHTKVKQSTVRTAGSTQQYSHSAEEGEHDSGIGGAYSSDGYGSHNANKARPKSSGNGGTPVSAKKTVAFIRR